MWGNQDSPRPCPRKGEGAARGRGLGRAQPSQEEPFFILFVGGAAAWTAEVTIVRRVQPPSQPPPAGGRRRVPAPSRGGSGSGRSLCPRSRAAGGTPALPGHVHRAWCAPRMGPDVTMGEPGSPIPPPAGGPGPCAGGWGNPVSPAPSRGRVWEGLVLAQGSGKPGFPMPPPGGRIREGATLPRRMFIWSRRYAARAAWMADLNQAGHGAWQRQFAGA